MSQDVTQQINTMRRSLQGRHVLIATCWLVVTVLTSALALAATDWLLGVGDVGGRMVCTLTLTLLAILAGRRWLIEVWQRRFTSVSVAQHIERRHPELRDIVTSALHFNQQSSSDVGAGSESLRRAVVLRAGVCVDGLDRRQLVSPLALRRAMLIACAVLLVVAGLIWQTPTVVDIGVTRLLNPFSSAEWPRVNDLQFVDPPLVLAAGDDLVLELRDTRGPLPATVEIQTRMKRRGRRKIETQTLATTGISQEVRLANILEPLEYRATGGDHTSMRWHKLRVVTPPQVESLQLTVFPPSYTNLSEQQFETGESLLTGSRLQLVGKLDRQAKSVFLLGENGATIQASLESDKMTFRTHSEDWQIASSDTVSFQITTLEGLKSRARRRLTLEVLPDRLPRVTFIEPTGKLSVTSTAVVPVVVHAQDDLAVRNIELVYRRTDRLQEEDQRLSIYEGPPSAMLPPEGRQQQAEHLWHLETLGLKPGDVLQVHAHASDYQPRTGKTNSPIQLSIVSNAELRSQIAEKETNLIERLQRLVRQQTKLRNQTANWENQSDWSHERWREALGRMLSSQRQLGEVLGSDRDGVIQQLEQIMADFDRNGLSRPEGRQRLQSLHELLQMLVNEPLAAVEQLLADWLRRVQTLRDQTKVGQQRSEEIAVVLPRQDEVIQILNQAIDLVSLENTLARYENEVAALQTAQQQLAEQAREAIQAAAETTSNDDKKNKWPNGTQEQRQLSRDMAKLTMRMSRSAKQQSSIAGQLSDAVSLAQELGVQTNMRTASDHLAKQQFGQALTLQQQAIAALQKIRKRLIGDQSGDSKKNATNTEGSKKGKEGEQKGDQQQPDGNAVAGTTPKESVGTSGNAPESPTGAEIAEDLVRDLWGHLPERQRDQILQPLREEFLPKYAAEIEAYFRALAEPEGASGK